MAGRAARLAGLPCSKEIHPVESHKGTHLGGKRPRAVCDYLFEKMHEAHIARAYVILRDGKWDIPAYLGDGSRVGVHLAYLMMGLPYGTPYSVDQAYPFMQHAIVAFGFPDMILGPGNFFGRLLEYQCMNPADVVLGLFPSDRPEKVNMVETSGSSKVKRIEIKQQHSDLRTAWGVAVWTPVFTRFMHDFLASHQEAAYREPELFMSDVVLVAIKERLNIHALRVSELPFIDIGTPGRPGKGKQPQWSVTWS
jgi:glucose-1-phosphate thymidylyltransferase